MHRDTYFINSRTQVALFHSDRNAELFLDGLLTQNKFLLHAFVLMPNHFHAILTPRGGNTVEDCLHHLKDTFSSRIEGESAAHRETWRSSHRDRRIRDTRECAMLLNYVERNPVASGLAREPSEFAFSSANPRFRSVLDELPAGLNADVIPKFGNAAAVASVMSPSA